MCTIEPPEKFTFRNVMYWEPKSQELVRLKKDGSKESATLLTKACNFLENNCVVCLSSTTYQLKPIEGYNKTTYTVNLGPGGFTCNCQGFKKKFKDEGKGFCSHCLAVLQWRHINEN